MAKTSNKIGSSSFLIGLVLAVMFGLLGNFNTPMLWILIIIGLIVGLLNVSEREVSLFLIIGAIVVIAASLGIWLISSIGIINNIFNALLAIFVPATIVAAIKHTLLITRRG